MLSDLQQLAGQLETTGRRLIDAPADRGLHRDLLHQAQQMSAMAYAPDLPLFIRGVAKDVEVAAYRVAQVVEAVDGPGLDGAIAVMQARLGDLRSAIERGRA